MTRNLADSSLGGLVARRRYLTILFADLSGSTRLAATMEAEHYAEILAALRAIYHDAVASHRGTVVRIQGDGLLAIFGHPQAGEDDGRRAVEAALDIHGQVSGLVIDLPLPDTKGLSMHSGIHAGLVLLDDGDIARGVFDLVGDPPNVAWRLSEAAGAGEILVSEATLGAHSHFFATDERRYVQLKGKAEPIAVFQIRGRAPVSTRFEARARRGLAPFVGRRAELQVLEACLDKAVDGQAGYVAISAQAGVGKTRLAGEFLRRAAERGCAVHRGYCESYLSAEPLQPLLQMLRSLFELAHDITPAEGAAQIGRRLTAMGSALPAHQPELQRALSLAGSGADAPPGARAAGENTVAALRDLFEALAMQGPIVVFVDDWQWADAATRLVVSALRELDRHRIMILTATRGMVPPEAGIGLAQVLELTPFRTDEAEETINRLLPGIDPFMTTRIRIYSGGNPLFLEELCHSAAHAGIEPRLTRVPGSAAWLDTMIESRVARLPEAQADLVRIASVIGHVMPTWLFEEVTGYAPEHPLVRGLADEDFVFPGEAPGTLRFKHGIARDVIYQSVGLYPRKALHLKVAQALLSKGTDKGHEEVFEALAYHYGAGGQSEEAARFAELAGDKAVAASALDRAQSQYRAALDALDKQGPEANVHARWMAIVQRLALALVFDASRDQLDVLERAVSLATARGDPAAIVRSHYWLGYVNYSLGEPRAATRHCELADAALTPGVDDAMAVQVRATLGQALAAAGDYERAWPLLEEAAATKRRHRRGTRASVGLSYTLAIKAAVLGDRGRFGDAESCFEEALDAVRGANHEVEASVLGWRSAIWLWQGRWAEARQSAMDAQQVAERVRSFFIYATDRALAAFATWSLDQAPQALRTIIDSTNWMQAHDKQFNISLHHGWLTEALSTSVRFDEMRVQAARQMARARKFDRLGLAMTYRALARAAAAGHGKAPAAHYLALAITAGEARQSRHEIATTRLCAAEIAAARDDRAQALASLDQAETAFEAMAMPWHLARARALRQTL